MHVSCVWFLSVVALRAANCHDPSVPSNQRPAQPQPFHTLYIKSDAAEHQLNMADKDRQSSASFSQCAAGGVMARVVKLCRERCQWCRCWDHFLIWYFSLRVQTAWFVLRMPNLMTRRLHICRSLFFQRHLHSHSAPVSPPVLDTCISGPWELWGVRGGKVRGTSHDQMCREKQHRVDPMAGARGLQHLPLVPARIYACMAGSPLRCCVPSPLATVSLQSRAHATVQIVLRTEVKKKSAAHTF